MTEAMDAVDRKQYEQCHVEKDVELFRRVTNRYTGVHRMSICKDCYNYNQKEREQRQEAEWEAGRERREAFRRQQEERQKWEEGREERERQQEQERQALDAWYQQQPDRQCSDCKQVLPASAFGYSIMREIEGVWLPDPLHRRCKPCHEAYRQGNRQVYPLCQMCKMPAQRHDFLHAYHGFLLDIIKVCCTGCIPHFESLPEREQMELLRCAFVNAYGETAVVYAIQYDDSFFCHHIGRTKNLTRRMADYRHNLGEGMKAYHVLQELPFGGLSMEYETRWILHAIKQGWPIDNFDVTYHGEQAAEEVRAAVVHFAPLTAPFESIAPFFPHCLDSSDAHIIHWFLETTGELNHVLEAITVDDCSILRP